MKRSKKRITVAFTANSTGTHKLPPLLINVSKKPRSFGRDFNPQNVVWWYANKSAWMQVDVFQDFLKKFDRLMGTMGKNKVLLLLDNAPTHLVGGVELQNVRIEFLPANTTSHLQPLDAGIISAFKRRYKALLLRDLVSKMDVDEHGVMIRAPNPTMVKVIQLICSAWDYVTPATVENCWRKCGYIDPTVQLVGGTSDVAQEAGDVDDLQR